MKLQNGHAFWSLFVVGKEWGERFVVCESVDCMVLLKLEK